MSEHGAGIVERLHVNSVLRDENHPTRKLLDYTIGAWLDDYSVTDLFENIFLESATGKWLDVHGKQYGVTRQEDESDDNYRQRIIYEGLDRLNSNYLCDIYGLTLYVYVSSYNPSNNTLTSDNEYMNKEGFMSIADDETKAIINSKFILDGGITWLTL